MKLVFDSNVLVSAFGTKGFCAELLEHCLEAHSLAISEPIIDEFRRHLLAKFRMPVDVVDTRIRQLRLSAEIVEPSPIPADACRDPDDLMVLGTAVAAQADAIVTGDQDLLVLQTFRNVRILSPRDAYEAIQ